VCYGKVKALSSLKAYIIYHLRKEWRKRAPLFAAYGFTLWDGLSFIEAFIMKLLVFILATLVWILLDEKIKEGYFFDPNDIGGLTHETIMVSLLPLLLPIALYLKKRNMKARCINTHNKMV